MQKPVNESTELRRASKGVASMANPDAHRVIAGAIAGLFAGCGVVFFAFAITPGIGHVPYVVGPEALLGIVCWAGAGVFRSLA